jgi:hypothetical protein
MKQSLFVIILVIVAGLTAACGVGTDQPQITPAAQNATSRTFDTQSNTERAVAVEVTPLNLPEGGTSLDFEVAFNTHSVDLSFDPTTISVLRDDAGREYPALAWEGAGPGGHHRSGVLQFKVPDEATDFIEVVIHDVAGVPERVFHWSLTQ